MKSFLIFLVFAFICSACAKKGDGVSVGNGYEGGTPSSGTYLSMQADLTDATGITSNVVTDTKNEDRHLLKVTPDGKVAVVLKGEHRLLSFKLTPKYIVARVSIYEGSNFCSLIAIPRIQGMTPVRCLNRSHIHCDRRFATSDGYDVVGDEVFFAYQKRSQPDGINSNCSDGSTNSYSSAYSELRHWDGKSESVQTLFHSDPAVISGVQPVVIDVFTSTTNGNLCIGTLNGGLVCRKETDRTWTKLANLKSADYTRYVKQNEFLLTDTGSDEQKINLSDFTIQGRKGDLPNVIDFRMENGRVFGRSYGTLISIKPDGNSEAILDNLVHDAKPARLGKYGWYFNPSSLRRVDLEEGKVDDKDFMPETKLVSLTAVSWSLGDLLRVDGIGGAGTPSSSLITDAGRLFSNSTQSIPIDHPIELRWK